MGWGCQPLFCMRFYRLPKSIFWKIKRRLCLYNVALQSFDSIFYSYQALHFCTFLSPSPVWDPIAVTCWSWWHTQHISGRKSRYTCLPLTILNIQNYNKKRNCSINGASRRGYGFQGQGLTPDPTWGAAHCGHKKSTVKHLHFKYQVCTTIQHHQQQPRCEVGATAHNPLIHIDFLLCC